MKPSRSLLLVASISLVVVLLGGGLVVKVGAAENSYRQAVLFAEILSLVMDNYVDPVETDLLLRGAYEGLLGGLDPNGAYLTPDEVKEWRKSAAGPVYGPGIAVLKTGRALEIVAVAAGSSAAESGVEVGDQVRTIDNEDVRDQSLAQSRRRLDGPSSSTVRLGLLRPREGFERIEVELIRTAPKGDGYELSSQGGVALLRVRELEQIDASQLSEELADLDSRGVSELLVDLRNVAQAGPRAIRGVAEMFVTGELLKLRDRAGALVESVDSDSDKPVWPGTVAVLVNGATASGGEALARVLQQGRDAVVYGEATFGLGAEADLLELENGAGLLVSVALWETAAGTGWNGDGIEPDHEVSGDGVVYAEVEADQLQRVLDILSDSAADAEPKAA